VIQTVLSVRRENPVLFTAAPYQAVEASSEHVCAFTRMYQGRGVLVVVPRLVATLTGGVEQPPIGNVWNDAVLSLPDVLVGLSCTNCFTDDTVTFDRQMPLSTLLSRFPVGLFRFNAKGV
jgi:(1->4)-alpha-D-glucan 1-alpha-D-glucosylmutase